LFSVNILSFFAVSSKILWNVSLLNSRQVCYNWFNIIDRQFMKNEWIETNRQSYNTIARDFSATRNRVWQDLELFLKYIQDGNKVLDVGCGNGRLVELLGRKKIDYFGVDISDKLIEQAYQEYPDYKFIIGDALHLKLSEKFDVAVSVSVLNHFPKEQQRQFVKNIVEALKPNGYLLLSNWNLWNAESKKSLMVFEEEKTYMEEAEFVKKYGVTKYDLGDREVLTLWGDQQHLLYYYAFDVEELRVLLSDCGLIVEVAYYSKEGVEVEKSVGENIICVARKK